jgi:diguanylate cyclase (GGDEF)-like protein
LKWRCQYEGNAAGQRGAAATIGALSDSLPAVPALRLPLTALCCCLLALAGSAVAGPGSTSSAANPAEALVARSIEAMRTDPETSRQAAEQALKLLAVQPDADLSVRAHLQLCDYQAEHDAGVAQREADAAQALLPQARRKGLEAAVRNCEGELAENAGDNARALALFDHAVQAAEAHDDAEMLGDSLYQRGYLRGVRGDYAGGLADLRRARRTYERAGLPARATTALNGIAILYNRLGDHEQARHYYEQTLQQQSIHGSRRELAVTQHNLGRVYESLGRWDDARRAFDATLALSREIDYPRGEAYGLRGLAAVRNAAGQPQSALGLLQLADLLQRQTPDERLRAQILLQRGIALHRLKRLPEAEAALADALAVFRHAESLNESLTAERELAATQADRGEWQAAFEMQRTYGSDLERWLRNQLDQRFATLKVDFDTTAKERENELLLREKAATDDALAQARRAAQLQAAAIALGCALVLLLAGLAVHHRRTARRMRELAMTDELTGLPNRRDVLTRLQAMLADRAQRPCAALIVDLDHFKRINDEHGHLVGDELLRAAAQALRDTVPPRALLGRLGGEEFLVALPATGEAAALAVAERVRAQIEALDTRAWLGAARTGMTTSVGVAVSRLGEDEMRSLLHRADEALGRAKAAGRNRSFAEAA